MKEFQVAREARRDQNSEIEYLRTAHLGRTSGSGVALKLLTALASRRIAVVVHLHAIFAEASEENLEESHIEERSREGLAAAAVYQV